MEYWNRDDVVADLDVVEHRRSFAGPTVYRVILKVNRTVYYIVALHIAHFHAFLVNLEVSLNCVVERY